MLILFFSFLIIKGNGNFPLPSLTALDITLFGEALTANKTIISLNVCNLPLEIDVFQNLSWLPHNRSNFISLDLHGNNLCCSFLPYCYLDCILTFTYLDNGLEFGIYSLTKFLQNNPTITQCNLTGMFMTYYFSYYHLVGISHFFPFLLFLLSFFVGNPISTVFDSFTKTIKYDPSISMLDLSSMDFLSFYDVTIFYFCC